MSVLFKALAKASRAREAAMPSQAPTGRPSILSRGGARPSKKRIVILGGLLVVAAGAVGYMFLPDEPVTRPAPRPRPPILKPGPVVPAPAAQNAPAAPAAAPSPAPAPAGAPAVAPPEGVVSAPAPTAQPPAEAQPNQPAPAAIPAPAPAATASAPAPQPTLKALSPVAPTPAQQAPAPAPSRPAPAIRPVEEDLPTLLARLRRQKTEAALGQTAKVTHAAPEKNLLDEDGNPAIKVGTSPQASEDAARAAYEALLGGRYEEALAGYDRALAGEKNSASLYLGKAAALQKLGRNPEARAAYEKVLALDPSNREALTNMTGLVAAQAPERALADLRALHKANPGFSPIDAALGAQEAALGNLDAALEALGRAVALSPDNGVYRLNLAIVQDRAGLAAEAATSYRAALALLGGGEGRLPLSLDEVRRRLAYLEKR